MDHDLKKVTHPGHAEYSLVYPALYDFSRLFIGSTRLENSRLVKIVHKVETSVDPLTFDLLLLWVPSFLLFFVVLLFPIFRSLWLNLFWRIKMGVFSQNIVSYSTDFLISIKKSLFQNIFNKKNQFRLTPPYLKRKIVTFIRMRRYRIFPFL